jgi:uncharacterized protein with NRDE domain
VCTVVVRVEPDTAWPVTMLALRDESPDRPWDPPAAWWPERDPSVRGVRDRSAGGAWLAASDRAGLAVVLNRWEDTPPGPDGTWTTRGVLPLDAVVDGVVPGADGRAPTTRAFNLVRATVDGVEVVAWDGQRLRTDRLAPGVHMITHGAVDDTTVPRIERWLPYFRAVVAPAGEPALGPFEELLAADAGTASGDDWGAWFELLATSTELPADDPDAILRDTTGPEGRFATLSIVAAAVGPGRTTLRHARLAEPGRLDGSIELHHA